MSERKISLISMGAGNVKVLKETLDSFKGAVDEFVYGDLLLFEEDRDLIKQYELEYNFRVVRLPFNYIFQMGFASTLNYLASNCKNDIVMYMNTSEVIDIDFGITDIVNVNKRCNSFFFTHAIDPHRWARCYDKRQLQWSGVIHEVTVPILGDIQPYHKPIFQMADKEKDMDNPTKAAIFNTVKQLCYFNNYAKLVTTPKIAGATDKGWIEFAKTEFESMQKRMNDTPILLKAFQTGDFNLFMKGIELGEGSEGNLVSSTLINFQGARKDIL
jgi:hypothetical protein